ncbi:hypothetical protein [Halothiobacillus neapolitanus]|uniref:hypothetical protein n=1 Tax=Halothiobacillus neapolitanus TaxID=927 RepID=UPI0002D39BAA|nr:hypothetical protein [Halothiobacillus neapolitanus]
MIRRSRESGKPDKSGRWIPAYAGMTGFSSFPIPGYQASIELEQNVRRKISEH